MWRRMPEEMVAGFRAKGARTSPQYKLAAALVTVLIQLYTRLAALKRAPEVAYKGGAAGLG